MNPLLDEYEDAIPLKARNYSNMDSDDNNKDQNDHNTKEECYGTFANNDNMNKKQRDSLPALQPVRTAQTRPVTTTPPTEKQVLIRTDKHTGGKYRRLRSIPITEDAPEPVLNYEKEVYNSMNMYQIAPRNASLQQLFLDHQQHSHHHHHGHHNGSMIQSVSRTSRRFSKKDVSDEALHGYEWLGRSAPWKEQLKSAASNMWHNQAIALLLLALMVTVVAFIISQMTSFCWDVIDYVYTNQMYNAVLIFLGCLVLKCGFVFAAIFFTITTPQTAGSGIPELKAILSGIWIRRYLSIRGFFIKSLALVCALGSGLPIGIEGPVIHISAIIGRQLTKISMFQHIDRKMLLSAACACGIAVIFGAPIGGVLFSIEVTHHYYKIDSYWSAFLCATLAAAFTTIVQAISPTTLQLLHTSFTQEPYQTYEFIIFIILGAVSGFLGACYVQLHRFFTLLRPKIAKFHNGFWNNPYVLAGIVTSTYVLCAFILGEFAFQPTRMAISDLFNAKSLAQCVDPVNNCNFTDWGKGLGVYWNLLCFSVLNYLFSIWFLVLDWPCGCFASVFAIGASTGRLMGEILNKTIMQWSNTTLLAATYAVVGAASLIAGVTRTFSVAVIVIEMTLSVEITVPVLIGVVIAWTIASWLSVSLYDSILRIRGIPLLPITPKHPTNWDVKPPRPYIAADLMVDIKQYGYLNDRSSFKEVALMLHHSNEIFFPVLSMNNHTLLGEIGRQILEQELKQHGYGRHTSARHKLLQQATKRLQAVSMFSLHHRSMSSLLSTGDRRYSQPLSIHLTDTDGSGAEKEDENNHNEENSKVGISIERDDHFGSMVGAEAPPQPALTTSLSMPLRKKPIMKTKQKQKQQDDEEEVRQHEEEEKEEVEIGKLDKDKDNEATTAKQPTQTLKRKRRRASQQKKYRWDENGYLRIHKEKTEWFDFHEAKWVQHMNISPVTVIPTMPISQIYILFHVLHPDKIYVAKRNELVGVIDEHILLERETLENKAGSNDNAQSGGREHEAGHGGQHHHHHHHNTQSHAHTVLKNANSSQSSMSTTDYRNQEHYRTMVD